MQFSWSYILVAAVALLSGCSNSPYPYETEDSGIIYYSAVSEAPAHLDPQEAYNVRDGMFVSLCYEGLFGYDYLARPVQMIPQLAKEIPQEPEITTNEAGDLSVLYKFELHENVHYIDDPCFPDGKGREMTAHDFAFAFKRSTDPKTKCPIVGNFMRIRGLKAYQGPAGRSVQSRQR